jgi:hypothetical protein
MTRSSIAEGRSGPIRLVDVYAAGGPPRGRRSRLQGWAALLVFGFVALSWPLFEVEDGLLDLWMEEHRLALNSALLVGVGILARVVRNLADDEYRSQVSRRHVSASRSVSASCVRQLRLEPRGFRESPPAA